MPLRFILFTPSYGSQCSCPRATPRPICNLTYRSSEDHRDRCPSAYPALLPPHEGSGMKKCAALRGLLASELLRDFRYRLLLEILGIAGVALINRHPGRASLVSSSGDRFDMSRTNMRESGLGKSEVYVFMAMLVPLVELFLREIRCDVSASYTSSDNYSISYFGCIPLCYQPPPVDRRFLRNLMPTGLLFRSVFTRSFCVSICISRLGHPLIAEYSRRRTCT